MLRCCAVGSLCLGKGSTVIAVRALVRKLACAGRSTRDLRLLLSSHQLISNNPVRGHKPGSNPGAQEYLLRKKGIKIKHSSQTQQSNAAVKHSSSTYRRGGETGPHSPPCSQQKTSCDVRARGLVDFCLKSTHVPNLSIFFHILVLFGTGSGAQNIAGCRFFFFFPVYTSQLSS